MDEVNRLKNIFEENKKYQKARQAKYEGTTYILIMSIFN